MGWSTSLSLLVVLCRVETMMKGWSMGRQPSLSAGEERVALVVGLPGMAPSLYYHHHTFTFTITITLMLEHSLV